MQIRNDLLFWKNPDNRLAGNEVWTPKHCLDAATGLRNTGYRTTLVVYFTDILSVIRFRTNPLFIKTCLMLICVNIPFYNLQNPHFKQFIERKITFVRDRAYLLAFRTKPRRDKFYSDILVEEQNGFRRGRSCADSYFTLKLLIEKNREFNIETHFAFIDFEKVFDTLDRGTVYRNMII
ncbi:hypothetical protein ANN_04674 [Periplaneta americana]|uniref:Reverse transcriptase domain-containing protein n=1 Tax=Periplaneta americana TaxID=6978 RepID=A0ABQ8T927_PERAM|nr:hypothetical protein ANN_04674 [Periplaneta americana]